MRKPSAILLATENADKAAELTRIFHKLAGAGISILTLRDLDSPIVFLPETGSSFCEIADVKARCAMTASGMAALGDDSGLCVDSLNGEPGVKSRRWAGAEKDDAYRNAALIDAVNNANGTRVAKFVTCLSLHIPGEEPISASGECRGTIVTVPRGDNGFGYDPVFEVSGLDLTMAELSPSQKSNISHRALALENLIIKLGWLAK